MMLRLAGDSESGEFNLKLFQMAGPVTVEEHHHLRKIVGLSIQVVWSIIEYAFVRWLLQRPGRPTSRCLAM
jgi:hypothetical protein